MRKNLKKVMAGALSACLLVTCVPGVSELGSFAQASEVVQAATIKMSGKCGKKATWKYNKKTKSLTISGTGAMYDYEDPDTGEDIVVKRPWINACKKYGVKKIVIGDGITSIGTYAFAYHGAETVKLGKKLKKIGKGAFQFSGIKKVTSGKNVETIDEGAFEECLSLVKADFGKKVKNIKRSAFEACISLETVDFLEKVKKIYANTFYNCFALKTANFGDDLESIASGAFENCKELTGIYIGKSLKSIGKEAFYECDELEQIEINEKNTAFVVDDNLLLSKDRTQLYLGSFTTNTTCYIDNSVKKIDSAAVCNSNIENFEVGSQNQLYSSENGLLYTKDGMKMVLCPRGKVGTAVISAKAVYMYDENNGFESSAFYNCTKLEKIVIGKNIKYLDTDFSTCKGLKAIEVDAGNKFYTAENTSILSKDGKTLVCVVKRENDRSYTVPEGVTVIDDKAFSNVVKLLEHIILLNDIEDFGNIPYDITNITLGKNYCSTEEHLSELVDRFDLENIHVSEENPYYSSVDGVVYNKDQTRLLVCPTGKKVCRMPNTVTSVAINAFVKSNDSGDYQLNELYVSDNITDMTEWLSGYELEKIYIGKSVEKIAPIWTKTGLQISISSESKHFKIKNNILYTKDGKTLVWCPKRTDSTVTIPKGVTTIGKKAFYDCSKIKKINIPATVTAIEEDAFYSANNFMTFVVPKGKKKFYKALLTEEVGFEKNMKIEEAK